MYLAFDHDDLSCDDFLGERDVIINKKDFKKLLKGKCLSRTAKLFNTRTTESCRMKSDKGPFLFSYQLP